MQGTPIGRLSENVDLGTPSAPPFMDIGHAHDCETGSEKSIDGQCQELQQGICGDKGFAEESNKSVKTEADHRYDESVEVHYDSLAVVHVSLFDHRCL